MRTLKLLSVLAFVLASTVASAQSLRDQIGRYDVAGYPGNAFPVVLTFPTGVPASLSAVTYYIGTSTPLPAARQPIVTKSGNTATITYQFPRAAFEWQAYHEVTWSGRTQLAGDINAKLSNRSSNAPITTLLVASADKASISISLIGGAGGTAGVTAADIAAVGDGRYRQTSTPISWSELAGRPSIPIVPGWLPSSDPGYRNEGQVNALISAALSGIQGTLNQQASDILARVPFSTYSANRTTDQNATTAAANVANNALNSANLALDGLASVRTSYVPRSRTITINGVTYGLDQDINATVTAGQAGVTSLNGKNGNLSGFVESSDLTPYANRLTAVENGKVNAVSGMGLSSNDFTNGLLAKLNGLDANLNTTKQDKLGIGSNITVGSAFFGTLSVGSTAAGVFTLGGSRITKSDGFPFQFESGVTVTGGLLTSGNVTGKEIHLTGANAAETDAFGIVPVTGLGVRMPGGWHFTTTGTLYNQGAGSLKADGPLTLQGQGQTASITSTGFGVSGNLTVNGQITAPNYRWSDGTGLTSAPYTKTEVDNKFTGYIPSQDIIWAMFASGNGIDYSGRGTFHLRNSTVVQLVQSTLRGFDGYDEADTLQTITHKGGIYRWRRPAGGSGSSGGGTTTNPVTSRDSVLFYADSTKMRFAAAGTTVVPISTAPQLRTFLTTTQTNVRGVLADGIYDDGNAFEQTGNWTNVSLEAANFRKAILQNNNGNLVWIDQGTAVRRRVRLKDFVIRSSAIGAASNKDLAMYHHNELPDWDGLEWDGIELYHTNPTQGKTNGFTFSIYAEGKQGAQDATLKNVFFHNCYIHDIPRANEFLSHGFDKDRIFYVVVTNNKFLRCGANDSYGAPISYSGRIMYGYTAQNDISEFNYLAIEHVANRFMITRKNRIRSTAVDGGVGIAISDNDHNLTENIWVEDNDVNVMSRPWYAYGVNKLYMSGGTYIGRLGVDGTPRNSTFKNIDLTVWARAGQNIYNYVWQFDAGPSGTSSGNTVTNCSASSANTQANTGGPTAYTIHLQGGTFNNTFDGNTTILGKDANGNWAGGGGIVNDGAASNVITNTTTTRVN